MSKISVIRRHCQVLKMHVSLVKRPFSLIKSWLWSIFLAHPRGVPIVWPTAIIIIMKTASSTRMQQMAIATIITGLSVKLTEKQERIFRGVFIRVRPHSMTMLPLKSFIDPVSGNFRNFSLL